MSTPAILKISPIGNMWRKTSFLIVWMSSLLLLFSAHKSLYATVQTGAFTTGVAAGNFCGDPKRMGIVSTNSGVLGGAQVVVSQNQNGALVPQPAITCGLGINTLLVPTTGPYFSPAAGRQAGAAPVDDIAVVQKNNPSALFLYRNQNCGVFSACPDAMFPLPGGSQPTHAISANLRGNGRVDLVVASSGSGDTGKALIVLLWIAPGMYGIPINIPLPGPALAVAAGDFNGDGLDDLTVSLSGQASIAVILQNGTSFGAPVIYPCGNFPGYLATGAGATASAAQAQLGAAKKFSDIFVPVMAENKVCVFINDGFGNFPRMDAYDTAKTPLQVTVFDPTGTGIDAFAVTCEGSSVYDQFMPVGDRTYYTPPLEFSTQSLPLGITSGTFNGTNAASVQVANFVSGTVTSTPAAATTTTLTQSSATTNPGQAVTFTATVTSSAGTPPGFVTFNIDGGGTGVAVTLVNGVATFTTSSLSSGTHTISASYSGSTSPAFDVSGATVTHVVLFPATENLTSSVNPSFVGQSVTFTATISGPSGSPTATGTVTFLIDNVQVAAVMLNSSGQATFTTSALSVGSHTITANYSGDSNFLSSTASLTQVVTTQTPAVVITSSANPSSFGQLVTFTATLSGAPGSPTPTGNVNFLVDNIPATTVPLDSTGQATFSTSSLAVGTHIITANYSGDGNYAPASATLSQVVTQASATVSITASANPITQGESVTFSVTVNASAGAPTPTGTVTFSIDGQSTVVPLNSNGQASFTVPNLSPGTHVITVNYSGDRNYAPATATFTEVVLVPIQPPSNARGEQKFNRFATQTDIINVITWRNPTSGPTPVEYRIYRNENLTKLAKIVSGHDHRFDDHNRKKNRTYKYFIVSVDAAGNFSTPAKVVVHPR